MHEEYNYVENKEQVEQSLTSHNNIRYDQRNTFGRKLSWKVRPLCSLSLNGNGYKDKELRLVAHMVLQYKNLSVFSLPFYSWLPCSFMEQNALK